MKYLIYRTDFFNDQLQDIVLYIRDDFSQDEANDYLDYLEEQLENLSSFPYIGVVPRLTSIAKQGYRVLIVRQNLIFYQVFDDRKMIVLYAIVSSKRKYEDLI